MHLKVSLLCFPGYVLRVIGQKHAKNRWQRKSAITRACAAAEKRQQFDMSTLCDANYPMKKQHGVKMIVTQFKDLFLNCHLT